MAAVAVTIPLTVLALVAAGVGLVAAVRWSRGTAVGWRQLGTGLGGAATVVVGAAGVLHLLGLSRYGLIHLGYLAVTVTVPLVALGILFLGVRRGGRWTVRLAAVALLVPAPLGAYATHVEPYRLRVDQVRVAIDPARSGEGPVRVAVLADLQTNSVGPHERRAVDEVMASDPDIILVPGDLYQGSRAELDDDLADVQGLLGRLRAPGGVYFVRGDTDGGGADELQGLADDILEGTGVRMLSDEVVDVRVGDRDVRLGGTRLAYDTPAADAVRSELEAEPPDGAVTLLVSHRPDTVDELPPGSRVDLTVAGHTHGGQVVLPGLGPLVTRSDVPRSVARGGLHEVDGNRIYVSPGVGLQRGPAPQVRFLSPPSVAVLTLAG